MELERRRKGPSERSMPSQGAPQEAMHSRYIRRGCRRVRRRERRRRERHRRVPNRHTALQPSQLHVRREGSWKRLSVSSAHSAPPSSQTSDVTCCAAVLSRIRSINVNITRRTTDDNYHFSLLRSHLVHSPLSIMVHFYLCSADPSAQVPQDDNVSCVLKVRQDVAHLFVLMNFSVVLARSCADHYLGWEGVSQMCAGQGEATVCGFGRICMPAHTLPILFPEYIPAPVIEEEEENGKAAEFGASPANPNALTELRLTVIIPPAFLPPCRQSKFRVWGGGHPLPTPFLLPTVISPLSRRHVYTDDSDVVECAVHAGLLTWSGIACAKQECCAIHIVFTLSSASRAVRDPLGMVLPQASLTGPT